LITGTTPIRVLRDVEALARHRAVQPLVEEEVGVGRQVLPGREGARRLLVGRRLAIVVQVLAMAPAPRLRIAAEELLQLREEVGFGPEVAEVAVAGGERLGHLRLHLGAVVAVEAVALDEGRVHVLAAEDLLERAHDGRGAGPGRAGDGDDGVLRGHRGLPPLVRLLQALVKSERSPKSGGGVGGDTPASWS
jgi:hypothetical protein